MQKITTFLWFDNQAEEAMNFYASVFKNTKKGNISRYTEVGPGPAGSVLVCQMEIEGQEFLLLNGGPQFKFTPAISLVINCEDQAEIDYFWEKLIEGGGEPSYCGWLTDKFGLSWQVTPTAVARYMSDDNEERKNRVMTAVLEMRKLDLATLEKAYAG